METWIFLLSFLKGENHDKCNIFVYINTANIDVAFQFVQIYSHKRKRMAGVDHVISRLGY